MSLKGLPDFGSLTQGDGYQMFAPFEGGEYTFVPAQLAVATRDDQRPDFLLELVRGESAALPPAPHGVLDFRLAPCAPTDQALAQIRAANAGATLAVANFAGGFLRLRLADALGAAIDWA